MSNQIYSGDRIRDDVKSGKSVDDILRSVYEYDEHKGDYNTFEEWVQTSGAIFLERILIEKGYKLEN